MPEPVSIQVSGNVDGSIVVGDHNFVVNTNHGSIIYQQAPPQVRARQFVPQPPRAPRGFINRSSELARLEGWIAANEIVLLHGPDGMGKSSLLKQAANTAAAKAMPGGVLLLESVDVDGQALGPDDIIQRLFDALFESNPPLKVDAASARTYLSNTRPLILMDEVGLTPALQRALPDLFPQGSILLAADAPFGADSQRLSIGALPRGEALALLATRAELTLNENNRATLEKICALLGDISLALVVTGNVLRETQTSPNAALQAIEAIAPLERDPALAALNRSFGFAFTLLSAAEQQVLSAAALTPGVSMTPEWLSAALGNVDVTEFIERLKALGLLFTNSPRLRVPPGFALPARRASVLDEKIVLPRLIEFLRKRVDFQDELGNIFGAIIWAAKENRHADVIALGRALDPYLTLHGLWDAWRIVLDAVLQAARQSGQQTVEAWALHQLGTRAIGVGTRQQAVLLLRQALSLRQKLGDTEGVTYTQHNLNLLTTPLPQQRKTIKTARSGPNWFLLAGGMVVLFFFLISGLLLFSFDVMYKLIPTLTITDTSTPLPADTDVPPMDTPTLEIPPSETAPLPPTETAMPNATPTIEPVLSIRLVNRLKEMPALVQGNDEDDYFEVPITVNFKSQGNLTENQSNLSLRLSDNSLVAFRLDDKNVYQTQKDVSITAPLDLTLKISKKYQGNSIALKAELTLCEQGINCTPNGLKIKLPSVVYDFVTQAEAANWQSFNPILNESYPLVFNDRTQDTLGFVERTNSPEMEDGSFPGYVLFTHPIWDVPNGEIVGRYENGTIGPLKAEDRLVLRVGFIKVAGGIDGVTFHVGYQNSLKSQDIFQIHDDGADGAFKNATIRLPADVITRNFSFIYLRVDEGNSSNSDWAAWVSAYIARP